MAEMDRVEMALDNYWLFTAFTTTQDRADIVAACRMLSDGVTDDEFAAWACHLAVIISVYSMH